MAPDWSLYRQMEFPRSSGRILLAEALIEFCDDHMGVDGPDIAQLMEDEAGEYFEYVRSTVDFLGSLILQRELDCVARPLGGGVPLTVAPALWEVDDFTERFRTSSFRLSQWSDPLAAPDHWLFLTHDSWAAFLERWAGSEGIDPSPGMMSPAPASSLLRIDEVVQRTGLSRSSVYDKIAKGLFPQPVRVGTRAVRWHDASLADWINRQEKKG